MMRLSFAVQLLLLCLGSLSRSAPTTESPALTERAAVSNACGQVVNSGNSTFEASLVYECLTSVPFNAAVATRFLQYYNDTIQFQSTLAYLKNPPASYQQPAVDFVGGLIQLQQQINSGSFANQYEFEAALQALIYSTHDDHVDLVAGILGVFSFGTQYSIASVSLDGIQLPRVYLSDDLTASQEPNATWQPSAIKEINGQVAIDYLKLFAAENSVGSLEPHSDFNQLMTSPAQDIQSLFSVWGGGATFYPGDTLTILLENGTTIGPTPWLAVYNSPGYTGPLETGGDFYNFFVLGFYPASAVFPDSNTPAAASSAAPSSTASPDTTDTSDTSADASPTPLTWGNPAYPDTPDVAQQNLSTGGFVSGYFLRNSSIAVLSIPSFDEAGEAINTFSSTIRTFLNASKEAGMKKVVIDLQSNYGGVALLAFDTFKQFFPTINPYGGSRLRAHPSANVMGETITEYWDSLDPTYEDYYNLLANEWVATDLIDANTGQNFSSWAEFYGPHLYNGDNFTTVQQYNLSSTLYDTWSVDDYDDYFSVYGYGAEPANASQPYAASDIIILSDSLCSSTCALFYEMMREAGVRSVVAGGLPSYGPMQAPSLSRGARAYTVTDELDSNIAYAQYLLQDEDDPRSNFLPNRTEALDVYVEWAQINLRDQIRSDSNVPLQFVYQAADCRIFFTPQTFYNYTLLWQYAADAIWTKPQLCVQNSTGYATTNTTDTTGPPSAVLVDATATTTPIKMGSIIMSMLLDSTPTEDKGIPGAPEGSTARALKSFAGPPCPDGYCSDDFADYYCLPTFLACNSNGNLVKTPTCVPECFVNPGKCPGNGKCIPFYSQEVKNEKENAVSLLALQNELKNEPGYCQPPPANPCPNPNFVPKVNQGKPKTPGKRDLAAEDQW